MLNVINTFKRLFVVVGVVVVVAFLWKQPTVTYCVQIPYSNGIRIQSTLRVFFFVLFY